MKMEYGILAVGLFLLFALVQLFYYLYFFGRLAFYKNKRKNEAVNMPISIIICAKNEETNVRKNFSSWINQQYYNERGEINYELLIVDDNSEDGSFYFYNEVKNKYPHLRILALTQQAKGIKGKKFPLSMGIKEAKYEHVLLTDADCMPTSELWLATMVQQYYNDTTKIILGYGPYEKDNTFLNKWIRWETLHTAMQYLSYALAKMPYMGVGRNLSYTKTLFNKNKGFSSHNDLMSGDDDLFINEVATAHNTNICIDPNTFMYSTPKQTWENWWFQKNRHMGTGIYYKTKFKILLGVYSASHFLFWISLFWAAMFSKFWILVASVFLIRWIVMLVIVRLCAVKLKEHDISFSAWLFDIMTLYYNIKLFPSLFRSQNRWK